MAAKISVQLHIGVGMMQTPGTRQYGGMRAELTDVTGETKTVEIGSEVVPETDEGGNLQFVADFEDVQSGGTVHCVVRALDGDGAQLGEMVTHTALLAEVPDEPENAYPQPMFLFIGV